jgi:hypothetical protein
MLLESLGKIIRLGEVIFEYEKGYQYPVAEIEDSRAEKILKGEEDKIKRGIPPSIRKAISKAEVKEIAKKAKEVPVLPYSGRGRPRGKTKPKAPRKPNLTDLRREAKLKNEGLS